MENEDFKSFAKSMVDYIIDYRENIRERPVVPDIKFGYLRSLIPETAPSQPESWQNVMADIERVIMPGVTHWQSPKFHAYYPLATSYPSIVADMLSNALACNGFTWISNPACTELEIIVLDWLGKMVNLPEMFLNSSDGKGGGVIQNTASESTLAALLAAKAKKIGQLKELHPEWSDGLIASKLVAYTSSLAHSSVERAGLLSGVLLRSIEADENNMLRGKDVDAAIQQDLKAGLIPFYIVATLGTTAIGSFDCLDECGPIASKHNVWLHIDAAYAGSAFICPEYRYLMHGIEWADSFNFDPHKWLMVTSDCSTMWFKDASWFINAFNVDPLYLKHNVRDDAVIDYRHWQIPMSRRFRALKLWFVLRLYGIEQLQDHIRKQCKLAKQFERLCKADERFEIIADVSMGLVCFRLRDTNKQNEELLERIIARRNIYMVPSKVRDTFFLRMVINSAYTTTEDVEYSWIEVSNATNELLENKKNYDVVEKLAIERLM